VNQSKLETYLDAHRKEIERHIQHHGWIRARDMIARLCQAWADVAVLKAEEAAPPYAELERWVAKRVAELLEERARAISTFQRTDEDVHLDKLISLSGKLKGYKEVLDYLTTHAALSPGSLAARGGWRRWLI